MLDVAVIIVSWNVRDYLANCLRSLCPEANHSELNVGIWVVDNASTDGTVALLADLFPHVHLIANEENVGFGAANNQGMSAAAEHHPRYYFLLNPDTVLRKGALAQMVHFMDDHPHAGVAGARLVYGDGRFQHSAFSFPGLTQLAFELFPLPNRLYETRLNGRYPLRLYQSGNPFPVDHTLGATMLVRADVAEQTDGFDENFHMYCEEIDWSWRIRKSGWDIYTVPQAEIVHYGGESAKQAPTESLINLWRSRAQLYREHHKPIKAKLAAHMVKLGMSRKAAATSDPDLKRAYERIIHIWQSSNGHHGHN